MLDLGEFRRFDGVLGGVDKGCFNYELGGSCVCVWYNGFVVFGTGEKRGIERWIFYFFMCTP